MWLVLHALAGFFLLLLLLRGVGISRVIVPNFPLKCHIFKALALWREPSGGWRGGAASVDTGIIAIQVASDRVRPTNQSIHSSRSDPHPIEKRRLNGCFERSSLWSLRGLLKSSVSPVSLVSPIKLWLTDWVGWGWWLMPTMYVPLVLMGAIMGPALVRAQFLWNLSITTMELMDNKS